MKRFAIAMLLLTSMTAFAQSPVIRAHFEPSSNITVGQPVRLVVSILVPNYFTGSPDFPEFEIENAIVVLPQDRPEHSNTQIGNATYFGISQTYVIYPQQAGEFHLPPAKFSVPYAIAPPKSTTAVVALPALSFRADLPAAARGLPYFLPTTQLTMKQTWSPALKDLRAGDTVERTITVTAAKMQAMLIPPLEMEQPNGIHIYGSEPIVRDQKTPRGDFIYGQRIQTAKYFIQKEGDYTLPAIELKWWNLSTSRLVTATLPAAHFTAAANPNYVAELPPEPEPAPLPQTQHVSEWARYKFWIRIAASACLALLVPVWVIRRYLPRLASGLQRRRALRQASESECFRKLQQACKQENQIHAYQLFLRWIALAYPGLTVDKFLERSAQTDLSLETQLLCASLFANKSGISWDGKKMSVLLSQQRKTKAPSAARDHGLMGLNP